MQETQEFVLGQLIGRRWALGSIAGACSASEVATIRRIRDEKVFRSRANTWEEFCPLYLGISSRQANRLIRLLEEHGPKFFELAQLTRITADQYREIAPSMGENGLEWNGEEIELIPENAEKLAVAVCQLRSSAGAVIPDPPSTADLLQKIQQRSLEVLKHFRQLAECQPQGADRAGLLQIVRATAEELLTLEGELAR